MKLHQQPIFRYLLLWVVIFYLLSFLLSRFYLFSLGLFPIALYELKRTEGLKNTRPLSFLISLILIFQFLHASAIVSFLPIALPPNLDPVIFVSVILLILFSFLLIRYTWGSITKFLSIILFVGSLLQASVFWPQIQQMLQTPSGQKFLEGHQQRVQQNLLDRLEKELLSP